MKRPTTEQLDRRVMLYLRGNSATPHEITYDFANSCLGRADIWRSLFRLEKLGLVAPTDVRRCRVARTNCYAWERSTR